MALLDPITGLASSNTQNPVTGVVTSDPITQNTTPTAQQNVGTSNFQTPPVTTPMPSAVQTNAPFSQITNVPQIAPVVQPVTTPNYTLPPVGNYQSTIQSTQPPVTQNEEYQQSIIDSLKSSYGIGGSPGVAERKAQEYATQYQAQGLAQKQGDITALQSQLDANKLLQGIGGTATNVGGITQGQYDSSLAQKNLLLSSQIMAAQGQFNSAKSVVDTYIQNKYAPAEASIQSKLDALASVKGIVTAEQQKAHDQQVLAVDAKQKDVTYAKTQEKSALDLVHEAISNGVPQSIIGDPTKYLTPQDVYNNPQLAQYVGATKYANAYGQLFNTKTGQFVTPGTNPITGQLQTGSSPGVVAGYDISNYATNPTNATQVSNLYQQATSTGQITNPAQAQEALLRLVPNSKLSGADIMSSATRAGVDPAMIIAMVANESTGGTSSVAINNNNLAGTTWIGSPAQVASGATQGTARPTSEGGYYAKFPTTQASLDYLSNDLAARKSTAPQTQNLATKDPMALQILGGSSVTLVPKTQLARVMGEVQKVTGAPVDTSKMQAQDKYFSSVNTNNMLTNSNVVVSTLQLLKQASDKINNGDVTGANTLINSAKLNLKSDQNVADYNVLATIGGDELGKLLGSGQGSDFATGLGLSLTPKNLSNSTTQQLLDTALGRVQNKVVEIYNQAGRDANGNRTEIPLSGGGKYKIKDTTNLGGGADNGTYKGTIKLPTATTAKTYQGVSLPN